MSGAFKVLFSYPLLSKNENMKKILCLVVLVTLLYSCSRAVTPYEAANHHYSKCRDVR